MSSTDTTTTAAPTGLGAIIEADITAIVAKATAWEADVEGAIQVIASEVESFFQWLASETPAITAAVQTATGFVAQVQAAGVPIPASLASDVNDLSVAVAGLQAVASATNAGANPATAIVQGYTAAKSAAAAAANVSAAAMTAATMVAPPAAASAA
jgi:hypothetical protein